MQKKTATILISGGIDSASCAHFLLSKKFHVEGIFFDYGQSALKQEMTAVNEISGHLGFQVSCIKLGKQKFGKGELIGRNLCFISNAIFLGKVHSGLLALGIHSGTPYYDCSKSFFDQTDKIVQEHTDGKLALLAPFLDWNKAEIYRYFNTTGISSKITYSCEQGKKFPCGKCLSCNDRKNLHVI